MSKRIRLSLCALGIALLIAAGALFATYDQWALALGRWQLHKRLSGLSYSALSFQSGRFVLDSPAIEELQLSAERIDIRPKILSRQLEVRVEKPHIVLDVGKASGDGNVLDRLRGLTLNEGTLEVRGAAEPRFFQIDGELGSRGDGWLHLKGDGEIHLVLAGEALRGRVREMASEDLAALCRALVPGCEDLTVLKSGTVTGRLSTRLGERSLTGELRLTDCHFASRGLELGCDSGLLQFEQGEVRFEMREGGRLASGGWSAQGLTGHLTLDEERIGVKLQGEVTHADASAPMVLEGQLPLRNFEELHLQLEWPGREAKVQVLGKRLAEEEHRVALRLEGLGSLETALIGAVARDLFPTLGKTELEAERMEGQITGRIESGQLTELNLREFLATDASFSCEPLGIEGKVAKVRGDLVLVVTPQRLLRRAMGSFEISGGELELGGEHRLSDLSAHGTLRRGKLIGGGLQGRFDGLLAELHLDHSNLKLQASGPSSALLPFPTNEQIEISGEIHLQEGGFEVEGECKLGQMELPFGMRLIPSDERSSGDLAAWTPLFLSLVDGWHGPIPSGVRVEKGWFRGSDVLLEQMVAPFANLPCDLRGKVDLEGEFDRERMAIQYSGREITLDSELFHIELPEVAGAQHQFEFASGDQRGSIGLEGATYLEKHLNIPFENVSAVVTLSNDGVKASSISASWNGMEFGGSVESSDGRVVIKAPKGRGSALATRELLRRIVPLDCWEWPIEGECATRDEGLVLQFVDGEPVTGSVALDLTEASWQMKPEAKISNATVAIDYSIGEDQLRLQNLTGQLELAGDTLPLDAKQVTLERGDLTFDITAGDEVRLVGNRVDGSVALDATSHFGGIEPQLQQLDEEAIRATPRVNLATVERDLRWLRALEVIDFEVPELGECSGKLKGRVTRNGSATHLTCEGKKIQLRGRDLGDLHFRGQKLSESWEVTQGRLGDWELKGEGEGFTISHFAISEGNRLSARGKGKIVDGNWALNIERWNSALPHGFLDGEGTVVGPLADPTVRATARGQDLSWDGVRISLRQPFALEVTKRGATLSALDGWVVDAGHPIRAAADGIHIDFADSWRVDDVRFQIPVQELGSVTQRLRTLCDLPEPLWEGVLALKSEGELVGRATLTPNTGTLRLQSDRYSIAGKELELHEPTITYGKGGAEVRGALAQFHMLGLWTPEAPDAFELRLDTKPPERNGEAIAAHFDLDALKLRRLDGAIDGLRLDLKVQERDDELLHLTGRVAAKFPQVNELLPDTVTSALETAQLGEEFTLIGNFVVPTDELSRTQFEGTISADQCKVGGYVWQHLHGRLQIEPGKCDIRSLAISDPAGALQIDRVLGRQVKPGQWQVTCPSIVVTDFRPTSLRRADSTLPQPRTFTITHAELTDIKGNTANPGSWSGKGHLDFSNPPKRDLSGTLFALPEDLMASLGLDLGNFVPTNGRVHYRLKGDRFVLGKFENVYSRGQHSQFLLAKGESSIGLGGDLDLRVKVRQYNLLLKPTELFYFKVRGSFSQPKFKVEPK